MIICKHGKKGAPASTGDSCQEKNTDIPGNDTLSVSAILRGETSVSPRRNFALSKIDRELVGVYFPKSAVSLGINCSKGQSQVKTGNKGTFWSLVPCGNCLKHNILLRPA